MCIYIRIQACVWLEEYLKGYKKCLVIISHSQDFLNGVCTNIIHFHAKQLKYYGGNYDTYVQTRAELEVRPADGLIQSQYIKSR